MKFKKQMMFFVAALLFVSACSENKTTEELIIEASNYTLEKDNKSAILILKNAIRMSPNNAQARFMLAKVYLNVGNIKGAEKEIEKAIDFGANVNETLILNAKIKLQQREFIQVVNMLEKASEQLSPEYEDEINLLLAYGYAGNNELDNKRFVLEKLKQSKDPIYNTQAELLTYVLDGKKDKALEILNTLKTEQKLMPEIQRYLGNLAFYYQEYSLSIAYLQESLKVRGNDYPTMLILSQSLINTEKDKEALTYIDIILAVSKRHALSNQLKSIIVFKEERYEEAVLYAEIAIDGGLDSNIVRLIAGTSRFQLEQFEQAYVHLNRVVNTLDFNHPAQRLFIALQLKLGKEIDIDSSINNELFDDSSVLTTIGLEYASRGELEKAKELIARTEQRVTFDKAMDLVKRGILKNEIEKGSGVVDLEQALAQEPDNKRIQITLALAYIKAKKYKQVIELSSRFESESADSVVWYSFSAKAFELLKDFDNAVIKYRKVLELAPQTEKANLFFVDQDMRNKNWAKAQEKIQPLVSIDGFNVKVLSRFYLIEKQIGDTAQAINIIKIRVASASEQEEAQLFLANIYFAEKKTADVITILETLKVNENTPDKYWQLLFNSYLAQGSKDKTLRTIKEWVIAKPNSLIAWNSKISMGILLRDYNETLNSIAKAEQLFPNISLFQFHKINLLLLVNELEEVKFLINKLPEEIKSKPEYQGFIGRLHFKQGQYDLAIPFLEVWDKNSPTSGTTKLLALSYSATKQKNKAIKVIESHLNLSDKNDEALLMVIAELYSTSNEAKALSYWLEIIKLNDKNLVALNNAAWIYMKKSNYQEAEILVLKALTINPININFNDTYLNILQKSGQDKKINIYIKNLKENYKLEDKFLVLLNGFTK